MSRSLFLYHHALPHAHSCKESEHHCGRKGFWVNEQYPQTVVFQIRILTSLHLFGVYWLFRNFPGVCGSGSILLENKKKVRKSSSR